MLKILLALKGDAGPVAGLFKGHDVEVFDNSTPLAREVANKSYDLLLLHEDIAPVREIKAADPRLEVILIGEGGTDEVEALKEGASAYFSMPLDVERFKRAVDDVRELAEMRRKTGELEKALYERYTFKSVVGRNPRMLEIFSFIRRIAPYFKTVTITGETGTGKEEIAKALHAASPRADKPFMVCNCGALVQDLIESELFGHKKGAFTGAIADKAGVFEAAGEGTVFLDEIADLPLSFQPHLLRVLQSGDFRKLGSTQILKARCRVIAATNRDLAEDVKAGRFREDLYFRLTPLTIHVPPLRERKDDIPLLSRFILDRFYKRTGKRISGISRPAQTALMSYDWPGNVRELENVIEQVAILAEEPFIKLEALPEHIRESRNRTQYQPKTLDDVVKNHIESVLRRCGGNRTHAARVLGISRRALLRKMEKYSIK